MSEKFIALRVRVAQSLAGRRDAGQGTLEYVGMIIVAAIVVVAVITAFQGVNLGNVVTTQVNKITSLGG
jgi:hypothetical protein